MRQWMMSWALAIAVLAVAGPTAADQSVGIMNTPTDCLRVTATPKGSVWTFTSVSNAKDSQSITLSVQQLQKAQQFLQNCEHTATADLPSGRSITLGNIDDLYFQVSHESTPPHKVYVRLGGHALALDPYAQNRMDELVNLSMVAQKQVASDGQGTSASFSNQDQQEDDANRILHHWHGQ